MRSIVPINVFGIRRIMPVPGRVTGLRHEGYFIAVRYSSAAGTYFAEVVAACTMCGDPVEGVFITNSSWEQVKQMPAHCVTCQHFDRNPNLLATVEGELARVRDVERRLAATLAHCAGVHNVPTDNDPSVMLTTAYLLSANVIAEEVSGQLHIVTEPFNYDDIVMLIRDRGFVSHNSGRALIVPEVTFHSELLGRDFSMRFRKWKGSHVSAAITQLEAELHKFRAHAAKIAQHQFPHVSV